MHTAFTWLQTTTLAFLLLLCTSLQAADGGPETLFALINERLSYMEQVALYKNHNNLAIEDLEREQLVIESSKRSAAGQGLDPQSIESFFAAQIAVAKAIQYRHLADWLSTPNADQPPDLQSQLRPALTELGDRIINSLALLLQSGDSVSERHRQAFHAAITVRHVGESDKALLFETLAQVKN